MMNETLFLIAQFIFVKFPRNGRSLFEGTRSRSDGTRSLFEGTRFQCWIDRRMNASDECWGIKNYRSSPVSTTLVLKTIFGLLKYVSRTPTLTDHGSAPDLVIHLSESARPA